ncbi:MAG: hypothetical protein AB7E71_04475 [Dongiaceae bacterium]
MSALGLVVALVAGLLGSSNVQVTFLGGGVPTYDASNFEDCGPSSSDGAAPDDDCYAYLRAGADATVECDYILGFRAGAAPVTRLRVKLALMRDGKVIGRDSIQINSLERPAEDPYVTKTIRGECEAKQVRILEAHARIDGQETDLIAVGGISSKGLVPFLPDFFIKVGPAA